MLKIKDSVDLKELEKFGFKYDGALKYYVWSNERVVTKQYVYIYRNRHIGFWYILDEGFCLLFDLIQAGLVEKVEE